tara:strand:- start:276 stop:524 length:249 start_codon:yes stop_codon:yes gene_type:complete
MINFKEEFKRIGGDRLNPKKNLTEIKVIKANKIDSRTWRNMKYDLRNQFMELVKIGEDYSVFQNAQGTHKMLKQIKKIMDKI